MHKNAIIFYLFSFSQCLQAFQGQNIFVFYPVLWWFLVPFIGPQKYFKKKLLFL